MELRHDLAVRPDLQRELEPGERLLWVGRADPARMILSDLYLLWFAIPWTALFVWLSFQIPELPPVPGWLLRLGMAPFVLFGLSMLLSPLWAYLKGRRTLYAITDRQVLIVTEGRTRTVQSFREGEITKIVRTERPDGSGDLTFSERVVRDDEAHTRVEDVALIGIPEVREVEKILRSAFRKG